MPNGAKSSPTRIEATMRAAEAVRLRIQGFSFECAGPDFSGHEFGVKPCQEKGAWNAE